MSMSEFVNATRCDACDASVGESRGFSDFNKRDSQGKTKQLSNNLIESAYV